MRASLLSLALLLPGLAACGPQEGRERVVLVTIDTLRVDSLLPGQGGESDMPRTWQVAREGLVFERFYAATPVTQPTHASIFTGQHPWRHGLLRNGLSLAPEKETVAERFRAAGWATGAVVASFPLHGKLGFAQGFDDYRDRFEVSVGSSAWNEHSLEGDKFYTLAESITAQALEQLDTAGGARQFFWFHYFDPHAPYGDAARASSGTAVERLTFPALLDAVRDQVPSLPRLLSRARNLYDRDVLALDRSLEELWQRLFVEDAGWRTHLAFVSDHGESFGEDDYLGHGRRLSPEQVHVPCFLRSPELAAGRRTDVAGSVDLFPTLLALGGLAPPDSQGRVLFEEDPGARAAGMRVLREAGFPNYRMDGTPEPLDRHRYFLIDADHYLAGHADEVLLEDAPGREAPEALAESARGTFRAFEAEAEGAELDLESLDAEARRALEALGYLDAETDPGAGDEAP